MNASGNPRSRTVLRLVAGMEALKGLVVLLTASGLLALVHHDLHALAVEMVRHAHLNPAAKYPTIFVDAVSHLGQRNLMTLAAGAAAYSTLRLAEGYGLWFDRAWAEWLAAVSGGIYVPFELLELWRHPGWLSIVLLLFNLLVVAVMVRTLRQRRGETRPD
ncbi:MAG: DUF2127 domain-containing protein [Hydrogenophaga sp.]|nr:DUF2127 domain-containing protein [Hydrogenophaga sp.]